jgi:RNA polymerase sigma-70 factor (ECF subfamily)
VVESGQQSDAPRAVRSSAPSPRKKVTVSLTPAQAESLRALWQEHSAALHAMLTGWCGNAQNASDMLQELFRRLAESPSVLVRMKNTRAFLAVSARRIAVDFARRSATRTSYQTAAGAEVPVVENPGPTDENLRAAIKGALDELPAEQRVVFEHKVLKGRTLEEIARLESISLNTAASRLRYALDKIRGQLRPYYDDLNRSQFKNMKNDLNQDLSENKRIITPLEPKRVPSVVPGLEGLAALSADSGVSDAPTPEVAECYALPTVEAPAPEFVEPQIHIDPFFVPPPTGGIDPIPETCWEETAPEIVDGGNGELPELVICEMFPPDGQIPTEWLKPLELPEEFLVTIFEGEGETGVVDGHADSIEGAGDETYASWTHLAPPFGLENGFEICVLPVPEEFVAEVDPREYLVRYDAFLAENHDWGALDPDFMEAQVITPSNYFSELEFGTPSKAAAFDNWYETYCGVEDVPVISVEDAPTVEITGPTTTTEITEPGELTYIGAPRYDYDYDVIPRSDLDSAPPYGSILVGGGAPPTGGTPGLPSGPFPPLGDYDPLEVPSHAETDRGLMGGGVPTLAGGVGGTGGSGLVLSGEATFSSVGTVVTSGSGLVLGGGTLATGSDAAGAGTLNTAGLSLDGRAGELTGGTVVRGGEVSGAGVLNASNLSLDGRTGDFPGQTVIAGGEVQIDPSLISQFDPSRWEGTGLESRVAELMRAYDPTAQSASEEVEAPVTGLRESGNAEESGAVGAIEPTEAVVQATIGKAPVAPSEVLGLPVEIAAAEISSAGSATGSGDFVSAVSTAQGVHSPNAEPGTASLGAAVGTQADLAPHALAAAAGDFVAHDGTDVSRDAVADASVAQKHDSTTMAAGAVAVGGVAHGSGAAAAAARKPLPQI